MTFFCTCISTWWESCVHVAEKIASCLFPPDASLKTRSPSLAYAPWKDVKKKDAASTPLKCTLTITEKVIVLNVPVLF